MQPAGKPLSVKPLPQWPPEQCVLAFHTHHSLFPFPDPNPRSRDWYEGGKFIAWSPFFGKLWSLSRSLSTVLTVERELLPCLWRGQYTDYWLLLYTVHFPFSFFLFFVCLFEPGRWTFQSSRISKLNLFLNYYRYFTRVYNFIVIKIRLGLFFKK